MNMKQDSEYELKLMLTQDEYHRLDAMYKGMKVEQTNHYFDTPDLDLFQRKTVIRLRQRKGKSEITVKTHKTGKSSEGILDMVERTIVIDEGEAAMILEGRIPIGMYLSAFDDIHGAEFGIIGSLTTCRKPIEIRKGLPEAELDESRYFDKVDHELEWEIDEIYYDSAVNALKDLGISLAKRETGKSKYGRLVKELMKGKD